MIKIIAAVLIIGACIGQGYIIVDGYKGRISFLNNVEGNLGFLKQLIIKQYMPISDALKRALSSDFWNINQDDLTILDKPSQADRIIAYTCKLFEKSFEIRGFNGCFGGNLEAFVSALFSGNAINIADGIDSFCEEIKALRGNLRAEYLEKKTLYLKLSCYLGTMVVIIMC